MAAYNDENMVGFPKECLPVHNELIRNSTRDFTSSFVGGMYRDSRMGIAEFREKRVERVRKQQAVVAKAQAQVFARLAELTARKEEAKVKRRLRQQLAAARKREAGILKGCARLIQRMVRSRLARSHAAAERKREEEARVEAEAQASRERERRTWAAKMVQKRWLRHCAQKMAKEIKEGEASPELQVKFTEVMASLGYLETAGERFRTSVTLSPLEEKLRRNSEAALKIQSKQRWRVATRRVTRARLLSALIRPVFGAWCLVRFPEGPPSWHQHLLLEHLQQQEQELAQQQEQMEEGQEEGQAHGPASAPSSPGEASTTTSRAASAAALRRSGGAFGVRASGRGSLLAPLQKRPSASMAAAVEVTLGGSYNQLAFSAMIKALKEKALLAKREHDERAAMAQEEAEQGERAKALLKEFQRAAVALQCFWRWRVAKKEKHWQRQRVEARRVQTAMMMMARLPSEEPDREATFTWLEADSRSSAFPAAAAPRRLRSALPAGPVDMSRTARRVFWLDSGGDVVATERAALRTGMRANSRASRSSLGGSVRSVIATGGKPFPTTYTTSSAAAHPTKGFRL